LIVINKPSIAEHASLEQDMAGDIRYCADVLDSSPADAARSLGWMKGRLLTQFVAFNELAFPNYLKISGMEVEEAGDIIEKHVGVNHQLVALKPYLSQEETTSDKKVSKITAETQYAAMVIVMQSAVDPDTSIFGINHPYNTDAIFDRNTSQLHEHMEVSELDLGLLHTKEINALKALRNDFAESSEAIIERLDGKMLRFRLPTN
jgi:hypothetical protein